MASKAVSIQGSFNFNTTAGVEEKRLRGNDSLLSWIRVAAGVPYFETENGESFTPVGQNDAITWPDLAGAFRRKNLGAVEDYFRILSSTGITCLRLMLEYCQGENRYLEKPAGYFQPNMINLWDDIFSLCKKYGLRVLLTPYDTFWMWRRWFHHPYNQNNTGPCSKRSQWLLCAEMRKAIKHRLYFVTQRWGADGTIFAWDLWNEIRPSHGGNSARGFYEFVADIGAFLRETETALHGRAHLQTVSVFTPVLQKDQRIAESVFHHPALDFATIHLYEINTIDHPKNTVDAAITTGRLTRMVVNQLKDTRPFFDSEHGPIKTFNTHRKTLTEDFDDEYFRHMQWAHIASGGTGGGMRWPYRHPHVLTTGMRRAQLALSWFLPLINWKGFNRKNISKEIAHTDTGLVAFGCADTRQAVIWLLRTNAIGKNKLLRKDYEARSFYITCPLLAVGNYGITLWNTHLGSVIKTFEWFNTGEAKLELPGVVTDMAIAIKDLK
jgi:hypothetical protein